MVEALRERILGRVGRGRRRQSGDAGDAVRAGHAARRGRGRRRSRRSASTRSRCARRSPATRATGCAPRATAATSAAATWSTSAKRSASSPRSRSASRARSSRCAPSTSAARRRGPRWQRRSRASRTARCASRARCATSPTRKGELVVISRTGEVMIHDDNGRERERHKVPYGATLLVEDGDVVKAGKVLAIWDATTRPIITEYAGRVKFENVEEGVTVAKQIDEVTGLSTLVVIDPKRRGGVAGEGPAPAGEADRRGRRRGQDRRLRPAGQHHLPDRLDHHGADGQQVASAKCWRAFRRKRRRRATSRAVCRAWRSCSRRARRRTRACWRRSPARSRSARTPRASSAWSSPTSTASRTST